MENISAENTQMQTGPIHHYPATSVFPMRDTAEYRKLHSSIFDFGQQSPIMLYKNQILDGRERYDICLDLGLRPVFKNWNGECTLPSLYVLENKRTYMLTLTKSKRAAIAAIILDFMDEEIMYDKDLKATGIQLGTTLRKIIRPHIDVGKYMIQCACSLKNNNKALFDSVMAGRLECSDAYAEYMKTLRPAGTKLARGPVARTDFEILRITNLISEMNGMSEALASRNIAVMDDKGIETTWIKSIRSIIKNVSQFKSKLERKPNE